MKVTIYHEDDGFVCQKVVLGGVKRVWTDNDYLYTEIFDVRKRPLSILKAFEIEEEL